MSIITIDNIKCEEKKVKNFETQNLSHRDNNLYSRKKSKFFIENKHNLVKEHFHIREDFNDCNSKKFLESKNIALMPLDLDDEIDIEESHVSDVISIVKNIDRKKIIGSTLYFRNNKKEYKFETKLNDNEETTFS